MSMVVMELSGGGAEPVSLADAKAWCRIERGDEDALVGALVKAARETVERETRLVLARRTFRLAIEAVPADRRIAVPRRPATAVIAATAYGADGVPKVLPAGAIVLDRFANGQAFRVSEEAAAAGIGGIEIDFTAGYEPDAVPEALKLALKRIVAASYDVRAVVPAGMQPGVVPQTARDLIAQFRERRL